MLLTHRFKPKRKTTRPRPRVDGRTLDARRYKQLIGDLTAELGGSLSTIEAADLLRAAHRTVFLGTNFNSRIFFFTDPTYRPSAIAIRWTSTFDEP